MGERLAAFTNVCRGILLGRETYEMFEKPWSNRTVEDDAGAPFFNDTTKYVVSGTLTEPSWRNSTVVGPYDPTVIAGLKEQIDGDLYTSGSGTLVRAMLADGLVDQLLAGVSADPRIRSTALRRWRTPQQLADRRGRVVQQRRPLPQLPAGVTVRRLLPGSVGGSCSGGPDGLIDNPIAIMVTIVRNTRSKKGTNGDDE